MDKVRISKEGKRILLALRNNNYPDQVPDEDYEIFNLLEVEGFVKSAHAKGDGRTAFLAPHLSDEGMAYITAYPDLRNPSIWDDKKYLITTCISVLALIIATVALFK